MAKTITRSMKINELKKQYDENKKLIRHEWIDATEALNVFIKLFMDQPDYQFGKTFSKKGVNRYGLYSEVDDYWRQDIVYDKFRDGTDGYIKIDDTDQIDYNVPIIRRYIVGRADSKNKLIDMLLDTFNALPDAAVQNKDEIISNLKEQRRKKKTYVSSAAKKDPITPETPKDVKVAWRSTCAAIPMVGLYNAVKPANFTGFDEGWKDYVKCELVYEGEDSYYKISVDRREENTDPEYLAKIGKR